MMDNGDERVLDRLNVGLDSMSKRLHGDITKALQRLPSYRLLDPADLQIRADAFGLLARCAICDKPAPRGLDERLTAEFAELLLSGVRAAELTTAVDVVEQVCHMHLRSVAREFGRPGEAAGAAVDRAVLRLGLLATRLRGAAHAAAEQAAVPAEAASAPFVRDCITMEVEHLPALRRQAGDLGYPAGQQWGMLVARSRRGAQSGALRSFVAQAVATVPGLLEGPTRPEPALHSVLLLPVEDQRRWQEAVSTVERVGRDEHSVVSAAKSVCALDRIRARYDWLAAGVRYLGVLPRSTELGFRECYLQAEAVPEWDRAQRFAATLGPLVGTKQEATIFAALDASVALSTPGEAAKATGVPRTTHSSRLGGLKAINGLDWYSPVDAHAVRSVVFYRWLAAAYMPGYRPEEWGPWPDFARLMP
jgi:hypothetical protein